MDLITEKSLTRNGNDKYGNPLYVVHYLNLASDYAAAVIIAKALFNGKKYHNKSYGGGIVFQSYNVQDELNLINQLNYTKGIITLEDYGLENTAANVLEVFKSEYWNIHNIKEHKTKKEVFFNWCMGLPTALNVEYINDEIYDINEKLGIKNSDDTMNNHRLYCYTIYNALNALAKAGL